VVQLVEDFGGGKLLRHFMLPKFPAHSDTQVSRARGHSGQGGGESWDPKADFYALNDLLKQPPPDILLVGYSGGDTSEDLALLLHVSRSLPHWRNKKM